SKAVWAKTNPMPSSSRDRLSCTWEYFYLAVRSPRYFFDLDAIRIPHTSARKPSVAPRSAARSDQSRPPWAGPLAGSNSGLDRLKASGIVGHRLGKNPSDLWQYPTANYRGAHHAVFPERLIARPLLASCPERICQSCGRPWERER